MLGIGADSIGGLEDTPGGRGQGGAYIPRQQYQQHLSGLSQTAGGGGGNSGAGGGTGGMSGGYASPELTSRSLPSRLYQGGGGAAVPGGDARSAGMGALGGGSVNTNINALAAALSGQGMMGAALRDGGGSFGGNDGSGGSRQDGQWGR